MRTIKLEGGAASIEGDVVIVHAAQEGSNEVIRVEIPLAVITAIQDATKAITKKKKEE